MVVFTRACEVCAYNGQPPRAFLIYNIHFKFTGNNCNLIGSQLCDLFTNCTLFSPNRFFFLAHEKATLQKFNQYDSKTYLK